MKRILGIDHGAARLGLAVSDPLGLAAHGLDTVRRASPDQDLACLRAVVSEKDVQEIVVGLPKNMDGTIGPQAREVMAFARWLEHELELPVHLVDERLTSRRAERAMIEADLSRAKRRRRIDRMAAQMILQTYLDMQRRPVADNDGSPV